MIREAQTYLVSAMSGATLIAIAIVSFVLLVSVQVFRDWPIAALDGRDEPHISDSRATGGPAPVTPTASPSAVADKPPAQNGSGKGSGGGADATRTQVSAGSQAPSAGPTATTSPVDNGASGDQGPDPSSPAQNASNPGQGSSSSAGGKSGSGSGGGETASTTTGKLTETVNGTVNQVDEQVLGGSLEKTGVTPATEGVVNGVVGPESPVGKVVDGTVESVTGLLAGNR